MLNCQNSGVRSGQKIILDQVLTICDWVDVIMVYGNSNLPDKPNSSGQKLPRFLLIDVVRGLGILGVVLYHFVWDLRFLQFTTPSATLDIVWIWFARVLQVTFMSLAGVSLVLAHYEGIVWRSFWKRFVIIVGAAMVVTVGTYFAFGEGFVYFGILHAIAVFSIMALPFLRAPLWLVILVAIIFMSAPFIYQNEIFNVRTLSVIGFWTTQPYTQDLQSIFPGFGYTLAGLAVMRIILQYDWGEKLQALQSNGWTYKSLVKAGSWSLIIYLVHQPIMLSVLYPLAQYIQPGAAQLRAEQKQIFYSNCMDFAVNPFLPEEDEGGETATELAAANLARAQSYCSCAVDVMDENDLFDVRRVEDLTAQQQTVYSAIPQLCVVAVEPAAPSAG